MKIKTNKLILYSIFISISCLLMIFEFSIFPICPFLKYDFSDSILVFIGFLFNPIDAVIIGLFKNLLFMFSGKSSTGFIGFISSFISSSILVLGTVSPYYYNKRKKINFLFCIIIGTFSFSFIMCFFNYFIFLILWGINSNIRFLITLNVIIPFNILKSISISSIGILFFLMFKNRLNRFIRHI